MNDFIEITRYKLWLLGRQLLSALDWMVGRLNTLVDARDE